MNARAAANLPVLAGALSVLVAHPAMAAARACPVLAVEADDAVLDRWPELIDRVHDAFDERDDIDRCARVDLATRGDSVSVGVHLPDGRSTSRSVSEEGDVLSTLEALLLVPEDRKSQALPEPAPAPSPPRAPTFVANAPPVGPERESPLGAPRAESGGFRIEFSLLTGARMGDGQSSVGLGGVTFLEVGGWLVGFTGRADRYQEIGGNASWPALELGLLGGRRFPFGSVSLDLTAGIAGAMQGTNTVETQAAPDAPTVSRTSSSTLPRALLGTRLTFGARNAVRFLVNLEGTAGPARDPSAEFTDDEIPPLPVWTVGLALGATVGTL
jgi:hypothetical protein